MKPVERKVGLARGAARRRPLELAFKALIFFLLCPGAGSGEQLLFDTAAQWSQWQLSPGAVELTRQGVIRPRVVRKDINASLNALELGGGLRGVGSNSSQGLNLLDGDLTTGWRPDPSAAEKDWWIELDLGRGVSAYRVNLVFAEDGPPFEIFDLLLSTGEKARDNARVPVEGTLVYRIEERIASSGRQRISFELDQERPTPIQYIRIQVLRTPPEAQLVEVEVEAFGDNLIEALEARGGSVEAVVEVEGGERDDVPLGNAVRLIDGLANTYWRYGRASRGLSDINGYVTINLGAVYWVDLVRLISFIDRWRGFDFKFYEILTSDGSRSPDGSLIWDKHFAGLGTGRDSQRGLADHHFAPIPTRYVRLWWKFWDAACATAQADDSKSWPNCGAGGQTSELQIFGQGVPRELRLQSPILDLGGDKNITTIAWDAAVPLDTRLEIRSRTGNLLVPELTFHDKNGKIVTERRWEKLIKSFRGRIDTTFVTGSDWSPWSRIYLVAGEPFQSPVPRRYLELEARLVTDSPLTRVELDWLAVEFSEPLAEGVVGEIFPMEVEPGVESTFSYYLRAPVTRSGFDRLQVTASTPLDFDQVLVQGEAVEAEVRPDSTGFWLTLPRPVSRNELVELRFRSTVFLHGTRFDVFLADTRLDSTVRQRVEAGDADVQVASNTNIVRLPLGNKRVANLTVGPRLLTPNGDGTNDLLQLSFDLVNLLERRPMQLQVWDLAGRLVARVEAMGVAGAQQLVWDGRDGNGVLVRPGNYILRLWIGGDAREQTVERIVAVAY